MMAIMGRMSAHTGEEISWEEAMNADEDLFAQEGNMDWEQKYNPAPVALPGVTQIPGIGGVERKEKTPTKA